jgi:hypothetical protein
MSLEYYLASRIRDRHSRHPSKDDDDDDIRDIELSLSADEPVAMPLSAEQPPLAWFETMKSHNPSQDIIENGMIIKEGQFQRRGSLLMVSSSLLMRFNQAVERMLDPSGP